RRGAGDAANDDAAVLQQPVEHPPGERAMRTAALERKIEAPALRTPSPRKQLVQSRSKHHISVRLLEGWPNRRMEPRMWVVNYCNAMVKCCIAPMSLVVTKK